MAGTIVQGMVGTEEQLGPSSATTSEGEKVVDMDDRIRALKPDATQLSTMTDKTPSQQATREKVNWLEEEDFPRIVGALNAQISTDTTLVLTSGQGKIVAANDLLRNMRTGEGIRVSVVATDTLTIARGVGSIAAASINAGDQFLVVGDAEPQGSDLPNARYLQRVLGYNFTQITRTPWTFTATDTAIEKYGGREPAKEAKRKAREHKRKWESILFWGMRSFTASSVAPAGNTEPQGTCGGMIEYVQTYKQDSNGPLTPTFFDTFLMSVMANGSTDKVLFAAPVVTLCMAQWNRSGMGSQWQPTPENVHGVHVDAFISGAYGYRIPVVVKKEWSEFPITNKGYGGYAFLVDMEYVQQRPLRDRDTKLLTEQQPKGRDSYSAEYLREASFEVVHERAHGILFGVTAPP
jgi:hypothetical protein